MPKAYSYLRFSTPEQDKGDSKRRQAEMAKQYAIKHGLDLDESLTFADLGVSAFRGRNAKVGALRAFLDAVEHDVIAPGSYLLIESLDRLSRDEVLGSLGLFLQIVNSGITLVTLMDDRAYSQTSVNANPYNLIASLVVMIRANEESATKAKRGKAVWSAKRANAKDRPLTATCPAWLELDREARAFREKGTNGDVVRRIFRMALDGQGLDGIAKTLNKEGVKPFAAPSGRGGEMWYGSYVKRLLRNEAVVGTYVPHHYEHPGGKRTRVPLDPIPHYYAAVIDKETFDAVQVLLNGRSPQRGRHTAQPLMNMLGGLARCPVCEASMLLVNKGARARRKLVCSRAKVGAGCDYVSVDYEAVEAALLQHLGYVLSECPAQSEVEGELRDELQNIDGGHSALVDTIENLLLAIEKSKDASPALLQRLKEAEDAVEDLKAREEAIWKELLALDRTMVDKKVQMLATVLDECNEAGAVDRARINAGLRGLFNGVVIDYRTAELVYLWAHGGTTEVMYGWPPGDGPQSWTRDEDGKLVTA